MNIKVILEICRKNYKYIINIINMYIITYLNMVYSFKKLIIFLFKIYININ